MEMYGIIFFVFLLFIKLSRNFGSYIDWKLFYSIFNGVDIMLSCFFLSQYRYFYMSMETFIAGIYLEGNKNIIIDHSLFKSRFLADVWKCKDSLWIFLSITLKVFVYYWVLLLLAFHKLVWKLYFFSMIILLSLHSMD